MQNNIFEKIVLENNSEDKPLNNIIHKNKTLLLMNKNTKSGFNTSPNLLNASLAPIKNVKSGFTESKLEDIEEKQTVKPQFQKNTVGKANGRRGHGRGCI